MVQSFTAISKKKIIENDKEKKQKELYSYPSGLWQHPVV
jgi:hypothetical protein